MLKAGLPGNNRVTYSRKSGGWAICKQAVFGVRHVATVYDDLDGYTVYLAGSGPLVVESLNEVVTKVAKVWSRI